MRPYCKLNLYKVYKYNLLWKNELAMNVEDRLKGYCADDGLDKVGNREQSINKNTSFFGFFRFVLVSKMEKLEKLIHKIYKDCSVIAMTG